LSLNIFVTAMGCEQSKSPVSKAGRELASGDSDAKPAQIKDQEETPLIDGDVPKEKKEGSRGSMTTEAPIERDDDLKIDVQKSSVTQTMGVRTKSLMTNTVLKIEKMHGEGAFPEYNAANVNTPYLQICVGDLIWQVNDVTGNTDDMIKEMQNNQKFTVCLQRSPSSDKHDVVKPERSDGGKNAQFNGLAMDITETTGSDKQVLLESRSSAESNTVPAENDEPEKEPAKASLHGPEEKSKDPPKRETDSERKLSEESTDGPVAKLDQPPKKEIEKEPTDNVTFTSDMAPEGEGTIFAVLPGTDETGPVTNESKPCQIMCCSRCSRD